MKRSELVSRLLIITGIVLAVGALLLLWMRTPLIHVSTEEAGGSHRDTLQAEIGSPLELHLTSDDVV